MRRVLLGLLVGVAVLGFVVYLLRVPVAMRLMGRVIERNLTASLLDELPDGLHVVLCGAGSPLPDPERSGPCVAVVAGERLFVVDSGSGASRNLGQLRLPQGEIDAVLLTHFHSDHIDGLGELLLQRWVNGTHTEPVPVYGPRGVEQVVDGFNRAYAQDARYRVAHHGEKTVPSGGAGGRARPFTPPADGMAQVVLDDGGLEITAFRVDHAPVEPSVGYRFDYGGRSVVLSGDTSKSANLASFAKGADLLVHDALSRELVARIGDAASEAGRANVVKIAADIPDYHASPVEAAETARDAGVGHLLYYHVVPPLPIRPLQQVFLEGVDDVYEGPVTLGRDGTLVSLPAGSDAIEVDALL